MENEDAKKLVDCLEELEGRRPRVFLVNIGDCKKHNQQKLIATSFADLGWDVDVAPRAQEPEESVQDAVDNDVHVIFSFGDGDYKSWISATSKSLKMHGREDIVVCVGGPILKEDFACLYEQGAHAILGQDADVPRFCIQLLRVLVERAEEEARL